MGIDITYDNRQTCGLTLPTSCLPYTGYVSDSIKDLIPCKPNANDIFKQLQILIDNLKKTLGDNTQLDKKCVDFVTSVGTQQELNQELIDQICSIKDALGLLDTSDSDNIMIEMNLGCLQEAGCAPKTEYSVKEILTKLVTNYCSLLSRIEALEAE